LFFVEGNISKHQEEEDNTNRSAKTTSTRSQTPYSNTRKSNRNRPSSATMTDNSESYQIDLPPALTKSALIYQLIRSRLQANLAKSISNSREKSNEKEPNSA
jgi:hypothetical protein